MALVGEGRKVGALGFGASCGSEAAILRVVGVSVCCVVMLAGGRRAAVAG